MVVHFESFVVVIVFLPTGYFVYLIHSQRYFLDDALSC